MAKGERYRSAVTGEFITQQEAAKRPRESVKETVKPLNGPNKPKK